MAEVPEHIHAFPRVNKDLTLPLAVAAWDDEEKVLYIGDGISKGGIPFRSLFDEGRRLKVTELDDYNQIFVTNDVVPVMIKTHLNTFYSIRGEDLSLSEDGTKIIIDISNALAVNNLYKFPTNLTEDNAWVVYFAKGEYGEKGDKGEKGDTPIRGEDFWTQDDVQSMLDKLKIYVDEKFSNGEW